MTTISEIAARCIAFRNEAEQWSTAMADNARELSAGDEQRFSVIATHTFDEIARLWHSREPSIPADAVEQMSASGSADNVVAYLISTRNEVRNMERAIDRDVDSSTFRTCRRVLCELEMLIEDAQRLGLSS